MQEAFKLLDEWLVMTTTRSLFSSEEIQNFMLDLRLAISKPEPKADDRELIPA